MGNQADYQSMVERARLYDHDMPPKPAHEYDSEYPKKLKWFKKNVDEQKTWMARNAIKPCPFCGSKNIARKQLYLGHDSWAYKVMCKKCYVSTPRGDGSEFPSDKEAVDLWNTRT